MTKLPESRSADYFAALYESSPDPWNFTTSAYERGKYQATLAALSDRRFDSAFEIGCSIGVLTRLLAPRCDALLAVDMAPTALAAARRRCADMRHVTFENRAVPQGWPEKKKFDLILFSEMLYFLTAADIVLVAAHAVKSLTPNGMILLVNYTEQIDEPCSGDEAAEFFIAAAGPELIPTTQQKHDKFRIDRLEVIP